MQLRQKYCRECGATGKKVAKEIAEDGSLKETEYTCLTCDGAGVYYTAPVDASKLTVKIIDAEGLTQVW